jgi:hypothetical protein
VTWGLLLIPGHSLPELASELDIGGSCFYQGEVFNIIGSKQLIATTT